MENVTKKILLSAMIAGMATGVSLGARADENAMKSGGGDFTCQGGNTCKGQGACSGEGHGCAGQNSCKGKGWVYTKDKAECDAQLAKVKASAKTKKTIKKSQAKT